MINISKLKGIVLGVDFDSLVNDKELDHLHVWADKNRNLAASRTEREIVKAVDAVLEDGRVTSEEVEFLVRSCDLLLGSKDELTLLFELNGLIDGVLCDGVINSEEVYALNAWLEENNVLTGKEPYDSAKTLVDKVLADGVVTLEEELELKKELAKRMADVRFRYNLNHLKGKICRQELIGLDLIKMVDDEKFIERIHRRAESEIMQAMGSLTGNVRDKEVVFISAVLIGLLEYDGTFWNSVEDTYRTLYRLHSKAKAESFIRDTLCRFQLRWDADYEGRIINIALSNAIVPKHFLPAFFEFVFDIYKLNLECSITDELEDDFAFAYEGLYEKMAHGEDNLTVETTKKTYKLIRATKDVVTSEEHRSDMVRLSAIVARIIDEHVWRNEVQVRNPYLQYGYGEWAKTLQAGDLARGAGGRGRGTRSRWEPSFELKGKDVYLCPPVHRIKDCHGYKDLSICVYDGNEIVKAAQLSDVRQIIGGYKCTVRPILLERPLGNIRYRITAKGAVVYDSADRLHRKIMAFDASGDEIRNNTDFEGTAVMCYSGDCDLEPYFEGGNYSLAAYNARLGDTVVVGEAAFNFSALTKPGVLGVLRPNHAIADSQGRTLPVYESLSYFVFEAPDDCGDFEVDLSGTQRRLEDLEHKKVSRLGFAKYIVAIDDISPGIHNLKVLSLSGRTRKTIFAQNFAYDPDLQVNQRLDESDSGRLSVSVESPLLPEPFSDVIDLRSFEEDWLKFTSRGTEYSYTIPLNVSLYRLDGGEWRVFSADIWGGDVSSSSRIELYGPRFDAVDVYDARHVRVDSLECTRTSSINRMAKIGSILSLKAQNDTVTLRPACNGQHGEKIVCRNRCTMERKDIEFQYDPREGRLSISWIYAGRGRVFLEVKSENDEVGFRSGPLEPSGTLEVPGIRSFESYAFSFFEKPAGLSLGKNRLLASAERSFYSWADLPDHALRLEKAHFDTYSHGKFHRRSCLLEKDYVIFKDPVGEGEFEGFIFRQTGRSQFLLREVGQVTVEVCGISPGGTPILSITKDGDGLLLSSAGNAVLDSMDDPSAPDIISFTTQEPL